MKPIRTGMVNMTEGSPSRLIFFFALPLLAGNMLQQLYNMVDSMVVGNYVGDTALAAVGTGFPIIFMLSALFMGMGMGATVVISQYYGANDLPQVKKTVDTIYGALLLGVVPVSLLGVLIAAPALSLLNVPGDTFHQAYLYVVIIFGGLIGSLGYNINAGILQGLGDSRSPLLFLVVACGLNIVLDLLFVIVFGWGVVGVAVATVLAQASSWIFGIVHINRTYPEIRIRPFRIQMDFPIFRKILRIGIPSGLQYALFSVGIMALQALVNSYGSDFMAGFNGANKLDTFAFMPIQSFATAATTYVGQNMGANRPERVRRGTLDALLMACGFSLAAAALLIPFGPWFMRLFSQNPAVIAAGMAYLNRVVPFFSVLAVMFILNSVMRGAGETVIPLVGTLVSLLLVRVPAAYLVNWYFGRDNMFFCYILGWLPGLAVTGSYYLTGRWRRHVLVGRPAPKAEEIPAPEDSLPVLEESIAELEDTSLE
ncbi:MATE family efflux transporter [Papillibacter cinnamivorans]|uniref:Putative efflux protein, MATE family n=1 Tax=Papillibacter cinnamivorans DSM 12816 TaxID=1122930 RepID=A0A1W2AAJ7_9FIRM|nr:MATE family efflux transporter [Papillibacter cinnamivorans]SMC57613.1 putative efflux protein, MATE family [Papillibacter cinnamivorans DSM 12816]